MIKNESQNCWEFWNCNIKQDCPAYQTNSGKECWLIASHKCPRVNQGKPGVPKTNESFEFCWQCPWFKKLNQNFDKENSTK